MMRQFLRGRRVGAIAAIALSFIAALHVLAPAARAGDIDSAKQQLEKAKGDLSSKSWDSIGDDIKATEEFLDGLPDADRAPIQKELDAIKKQAAPQIKEHKSTLIVKSATAALDSTADKIVHGASGQYEFDRAANLLNSDDAKAYVDPAQLKKLQDRLASLKKMQDGKKIEFAAPILKELDDAMAAQPFKNAQSPEDIDHAAQQLNSLMSRVRGAIDGVPADDPRVKAINAKLAGYDKQIATASGGAEGKQAAENLAHAWKAQPEYFAGWEQEKQGPTWEEYTHRQSDEMSHLLMPKTVEVLTRLNHWFAEDDIKGPAEKYKDDPLVKSTMAEAHKTFDTAAAKLNTAFNNLLAEAEKVPTPTDDTVRNKAGSLAEDADNWFKGTPYHDANVARAKKLGEKWGGAVAGAAQAKEDLLKKLTEQAGAAWPKMAADVKAVDGFTPDKADSFKGKMIHLTGSNRAAWDYDADYDFAKTINGLPVAGKFDPNVRAAVDSVKKQVGEESVPDDNWDVYAVVEGPGKIRERIHATGKVTIDGTQVGTVTQEGHRPIDCTVVRIVAMHAGPVAVGPQGAVSASGAVETTGAVSLAAGGAGGFSIIKLLEHLIELGICALAAGLVVLKSRPALATQAAGTGPSGAGGAVASLNGALAGDNLAYAGLLFAVLGILWLLSKLVLGDLFPALSLTLAGLYVASDWLRARGILPQGAYDSLKPLALPIAGAAVFFGVLHLFLWNWYLF